MKNNTKANISVQWHLTNRCQKKCRHCYMFDASYDELIANELNFTQISSILEKLGDFENKWHVSFSSFYLTGGDPFLRKDFFQILDILKKLNKRIFIMANPESITPSTIEAMRFYGIEAVQISLDGLENLHDEIRGPGSFKLAISAINSLSANNIDCRVMYTLHSQNKQELLPLVNYLASQTGAKGFAFDLASKQGNGESLSELSKAEIVSLFRDYLSLKKQFKQQKVKLYLAEKPTIMRLMHVANDEFPIYSSDDTSFVTGCLIGVSCITLLPNGDVEACRRFPSTVGNLLLESLDDIFWGSPLLQRFRRPQFYQECCSCRFFKFCRGCAAVSEKISRSGKIFPMCIKSELGLFNALESSIASIPLSRSYEEEASLVYNHMSNRFGFELSFLKNDNRIQSVIGSLITDAKTRNLLCKSPVDFMTQYCLSSSELEFVQYYFLLGIKSKKMFIPLDM